MKINPVIFREYDIRGLVETDLSEEFAYWLGRAYGDLAKENEKNQIVIGHDCRLTSPNYAKALINGINDEGIDTLFIGLATTPLVYFTLFQYKLGGGVQVTGSHNPSDMNGFKICLGESTLSGEKIQDLKKRLIQKLGSPPSTTKGINKLKDIKEEYISYVVANCAPFMGTRKLSIVVDAGNGVGGIVGPEILRRLGQNVIELYTEPDGNFPNHHPDPTEVKNLKDLISKVKSEKADIGIGWDGDADRIGAVDENGEVLFGDMLLLIFARDILKSEKGATFIGDVKCSHRLFDDITRLGGNPIMWKTGHSLIKNKLKETGAALAGEMSGHIFFKHRFFGFDDAIYSSARLVEILSQHTGPASTLLAGLPTSVSTPEIRVESKEESKFQIAKMAQEAFGEYPTDTIDGVRIRFPYGWGLIRASNTQPVLVLRFEADTQQRLLEYREIVESKLREIKKLISVD